MPSSITVNVPVRTQFASASAEASSSTATTTTETLAGSMTDITNKPMQLSIHRLEKILVVLSDEEATPEKVSETVCYMGSSDTKTDNKKHSGEKAALLHAYDDYLGLGDNSDWECLTAKQKADKKAAAMDKIEQSVYQKDRAHVKTKNVNVTQADVLLQQQKIFLVDGKQKGCVEYNNNLKSVLGDVLALRKQEAMARQQQTNQEAKGVNGLTSMMHGILGNADQQVIQQLQKEETEARAQFEASRARIEASQAAMARIKDMRENRPQPSSARTSDIPQPVMDNQSHHTSTESLNVDDQDQIIHSQLARQPSSNTSSSQNVYQLLSDQNSIDVRQQATAQRPQRALGNSQSMKNVHVSFTQEFKQPEPVANQLIARQPSTGSNNQVETLSDHNAQFAADASVTQKKKHFRPGKFFSRIGRVITGQQRTPAERTYITIPVMTTPAPAVRFHPASAGITTDQQSPRVQDTSRHRFEQRRLSNGNNE